MTGATPPLHVTEGLHPGTTFGSYRIVRCIGVGGMGSVFEGIHELLSRRVAIKVLHARAAERQDSRERFVREAQSVARIKHPNVVEIFDVGVLDDQPYIVMEFLEGEALDSAMTRMIPMDEADAVAVLLPIAAALTAVHRVGLVHRDVKPENVFLSSNPSGHHVPKLVDFGIAKDLSAPIVGSHHTVIGTPHFMSPEQARGSLSLDARTDQYSFAVMLYQLVTGFMPYDAESLLDLVRAIDAGAYIPPRSLNANITPEFEQVLTRAMSRDAIDRYPSMTELGAALLPFASDRLRASFAADFAASGALHAEPRALGEALPPSRGTAPSGPMSTTTTLDRLLRPDGPPTSGTFSKPVKGSVAASPTPLEATERRITIDDARSLTKQRVRNGSIVAVLLLVAGAVALSRASRPSEPGRAVAAGEALRAEPAAPAAQEPSSANALVDPPAAVGDAVVPTAVPEPVAATESVAPATMSRRSSSMQRGAAPGEAPATAPTPPATPRLEIRLER